MSLIQWICGKTTVEPLRKNAKDTNIKVVSISVDKVALSGELYPTETSTLVPTASK
jgi:hypothetical protein